MLNLGVIFSSRCIGLSRLVLFMLGLCCLFCLTSEAQTKRNTRQPWTTSKVQGQPGVPSAYRLERVLPELTFQNPIELVSMPVSDWMWMMELRGGIYAFSAQASMPEKHLVMDLKSLHHRMSDAYGLAFHPQFDVNRQVFLCYVLRGGGAAATRVSRFKVSTTSPPTVMTDSEEVLITWQGGGHNGGCLRFGPDGYLYISTGDSSGPYPPDKLKTGQDISDLSASILRIDVDRADPGRAYAIPKDNPFVHLPEARPEVWAFGFRNPFKMSFDAASGALWVGDVGWELWELIFRVVKGGNYGWSIMEGNELIQADLPKGPGPILAPIVDHPHSEAASITGGLVYRGNGIPELRGAYVYGDWETGKIWGLRTEGDQVTWNEELVDAPFQVVCFGEDPSGSLWVVDYAGGLFHLVRGLETEISHDFPLQLSETGVFKDSARHQPALGVYPYTVEMQPWENGTSAQRWLALRGMQQVQPKGLLSIFPKDAVLVKTLSWSQDEGATPGQIPIETQLLHYNGEAWNAYTYAWNASGTDARLVGEQGEVVHALHEDSSIKATAAIGGPKQWAYAPRVNCLRCHNAWSGYALGWNERQLAGSPHQRGRISESWDNLSALGLIEKKRRGSPKVSDTMSEVEYMARSYLHANCAHCHRQNAGGMVDAQLYFDKPSSQASLIGEEPLRGDFGLPAAMVVAPGDPFRSVLYYRMIKSGSGHMPLLGASLVDSEGVDRIFNWIRSMSPQDSESVNLTSSILSAIRDLDTHGDDRSQESMVRAIASVGSSLPGVMGLAHALSHDWLDESWHDAVEAFYEETVDSLKRDVLRRFFEKGNTADASLDIISIKACKPDISHGKRLFHEDPTLQCATCHRMHDEGGYLGPDLTKIREKYSLQQVLEHIRMPSLVVDARYQVVSIELESGVFLSGIIQEEDENEIQLVDITGRPYRVQKTTMIDRQSSTLSAMPEGLLAGRSAQELADLLGMLGYLKD
ncbi:MAG: PQQ-dependent sugar dehydrogenase [Verrucomicrobiota bacterium]|nr:PQQ-dependent sugar dehydrogenase [Verrucomicrobiota bacterium]